jgi:hypothetical protein
VREGKFSRKFEHCSPIKGGDTPMSDQGRGVCFHHVTAIPL